MVCIFDFICEMDWLFFDVIRMLVIVVVFMDFYCEGDDYIVVVDFLGVDLVFIDIDVDDCMLMICVECVVKVVKEVQWLFWEWVMGIFVC